VFRLVLRSRQTFRTHHTHPACLRREGARF